VPGVRVVDDGSNREPEQAIGTAFACLGIAGSVSATFRTELMSELEIQEGRKLGGSFQDHVSPVTSVAA